MRNSTPEAAPADAADSPAIAAGPARTDAADDGAQALYLGDLADLDDFEFGGAAVFGRKLRLDDAAAPGEPAKPLNARDLPRHQRPGMRFIDPRPLPLKTPPQAEAARPDPTRPASCDTAPIAPRPLPLPKQPRRGLRAAGGLA